MTALSALWLPILASGAFVFVVSSILHMLLPWHRDEYPKIPNEGAVMDALRPFAIPPGDYMVPRAANPEEMRTPEFAQKMEKGPVLVLTVMPNGPVQMGSSLTLWFLYSLAISFFAGYVASRALGPDTTYLHIFRFVGVTAFLGYAGALWQMSIWYKRSWRTTVKATVDGLLYALVTAGTFGWLWPR